MTSTLNQPQKYFGSQVVASFYILLVVVLVGTNLSWRNKSRRNEEKTEKESVAMRTRGILNSRTMPESV